nr:uncharacterized protein LOC120967157 isoform X2 [Aegilops tauschii subsp. strangulata]XP_045088201.1 uncharacterized protein LOC123496872 isoform X2 [Aegilops tauschii subsp. strangulata]
MDPLEPIGARASSRAAAISARLRRSRPSSPHHAACSPSREISCRQMSCQRPQLEQADLTASSPFSSISLPFHSNHLSLLQSWIGDMDAAQARSSCRHLASLPPRARSGSHGPSHRWIRPDLPTCAATLLFVDPAAAPNRPHGLCFACWHLAVLADYNQHKLFRQCVWLQIWEHI